MAQIFLMALKPILSDDTPCPHGISFSEKRRQMAKMDSLAGHAVSHTQQIFTVSEVATHGFSISTHQNRVFCVSTSESGVSTDRHTKNFLTNSNLQILNFAQLVLVVNLISPALSSLMSVKSSSCTTWLLNLFWLRYWQLPETGLLR